MANMCDIKVYVPLSAIPHEEERGHLAALYAAEREYSRLAQDNEELRSGRAHDEFVSIWPGVPHQRTRWSNSGGTFRGRPGEFLKPDSEQWSQPTVGALFEERDGEVWVHPYKMRDESSLFGQQDGIMVFPGTLDGRCSTILPMSQDFRHSFPWWAQVGFAGAKKLCDEEGQDPPDGQTEEFYRQWSTEHRDKLTYLLWEHPVSDVLTNLEYVIDVYEGFPVSGAAWRMAWVWKALSQLEDLYRWFKRIHLVSPRALGVLDWSEVAWNVMTFEQARRINDPNEIMREIREMAEDREAFLEGRLCQSEFEKKYAQQEGDVAGETRGYVRIASRDPYAWVGWL